MSDYSSRRYALLNRWDAGHLQNVDRFLDLQPGQRVLEVGCGAGHLTRRLGQRGIDIVGIDANPQASHVAESDRVVHMRAESLEFDDQEFDSVISIHAIEHIPPLDQALAEMTRVLKEGGKAMHIYPAEPIKGLYAIPTSVILHGTPFRAREVHCHKLWPSKLERLVEPLGMVETDRHFELFKSPQFTSVFVKEH